METLCILNIHSRAVCSQHRRTQASYHNSSWSSTQRLSSSLHCLILRFRLPLYIHFSLFCSQLKHSDLWKQACVVWTIKIMFVSFSLKNQTLYTAKYTSKKISWFHISKGKTDYFAFEYYSMDIYWAACKVSTKLNYYIKLKRKC